MALIASGVNMGPDSENFVPVSPGDVIAEKYRIERVLGRGGMGVVVAATHLHLDQMVALKFIIPGAVGQDTQAVERFMREARAAGRLKSEHVAKVYDVGMLSLGAPYIVMEYLEGRDLSAVVEAEGALPPEVAADYVLQACEAMAEAHSLGIVHRDLKPQNLFVTRGVGGKPLVKVLDFGVSKVRTPGTIDSALTRTASIMGSPMYMAPEQMRSARSADARSDIWALGVVLYTLLTGDAPFIAETMTELALKVVQDAHPPVSLKRPNVTPALAAVVDRCLEKLPANRFADVSDLAIALSDFAPPASRLLAEQTRAILKRQTDPPPRVTSPSFPDAGRSPSGRSPSGRSSLPSLPDRTVVSAGSPLGSTSAGWSNTSKTSRAKGLVGGIAVVALLLAGVGVLARTRHDVEPAKMVSSPGAIAADPERRAFPSSKVLATTASDVVLASAPPELDAGALVASTSRAPRPAASGGPPPSKDAARRSTPAGISSAHDDDIPALR